jgi:uncharacterized protein (DUF169 family)
MPNHSDRLVALLGLSSPPVALSFAQTPPPGVEVFSGAVPSACTLWRLAESAVIYVPAEKHHNCPVGAMTMGFDIPDALMSQLMELAGSMVGCGYLRPEEPTHLPSHKGHKNGIVYGPLAKLSGTPDAVICWLTPRQAMLCREAAGGCEWLGADPQAVWGRPACAVIPIALERSSPALSLGCMGMRVFTGVADDKTLFVVPGVKLDEFLGLLEAAVTANAQMATFYEGQRQKFTGVNA